MTYHLKITQRNHHQKIVQTFTVKADAISRAKVMAKTWLQTATRVWVEDDHGQVLFHSGTHR